MRRVLAAVLLPLLVSCSAGPPAEGATGPEIYSMLCSNCHGSDLEGGIGPPLGPGSNAATRPDTFLEATIIHGRGRMPSFSSSLSDQQVASLIDHIREVQER